MGVAIRFLRPWKQYKPGFVMLDTGAGYADMLINRHKPPIAEYLNSPSECLVPLPAGIGQLVNAATDMVHRRRKGK